MGLARPARPSRGGQDIHELVTSARAAGVPLSLRMGVAASEPLDEYVYEAIRAVASGFLLTDAPPGR